MCRLKNNENTENASETSESTIYKMQTQKQPEEIQLDKTLVSKEIEITGLYDPEDYGLDIYMWANSDGDQLKYLFSNIDKMQLSKDAKELMNIVLLTNSYNPEKNITENEFLKIRSNWLIKSNDRDLIEEYLIKNQVLNLILEQCLYLNHYAIIPTIASLRSTDFLNLLNQKYPYFRQRI